MTMIRNVRTLFHISYFCLFYLITVSASPVAAQHLPGNDISDEVLQAYIVSSQKNASTLYNLALASEREIIGHNSAQAFALSFSEEKFTITPKTTTEVKSSEDVVSPMKQWSLVLGLKALRRGNEIFHLVSGQGATVERNRLIYTYSENIQEWYVNGPLGIEHGIDIQHRPLDGEGGVLELLLDISGDLEPILSGKGISLTKPDPDTGSSVAVAHYTDLYVKDAAGVRLAARMQVENGAILLSVDDREAHYPIQIDPLLWAAEQKLYAADGVQDSRFGCAVAIDGNTAIVGDYSNDANGDDSGAAYVYIKNGEGHWVEHQKLTASDGAVGDYFGFSVDLEGDIAFIGANMADYPAIPALNAGAVYVFGRSGGTWTQLQKLSASDKSGGDQFGYSLSIDGNLAVIGAIEDTSFGRTNAGSAYLFSGGGGSWVEDPEKLVARIYDEERQEWIKEGITGSHFGQAVAVKNGTVLIGAPGEDAVAADGTPHGAVGAVYVFNTSVFNKKIRPNDIVVGKYFGISLAMGSETALVGAYRDNSAAEYAGAVYVYNRGGWTQQQKLTASEPEVEGFFGRSLDLEGNIAVIGSGEYRPEIGKAGKVHVFAKGDSGWSAKDVIDDSERLGAHFGSDVRLDGYNLLIGDPPKGNSSDYGWAHVYNIKDKKIWSAINTLSTSLDDGDPVNMGSGEYYFISELLDLGGPVPLSFSFYYGSLLGSKSFSDGLPPSFAGNNRAGAFQENGDTEVELYLSTGMGRELRFLADDNNWIPAGETGGKYAVQETDGYYYLVDHGSELIYIYEKRADSDEAVLVMVMDRNENSLTYETDQDADVMSRGPDRIYDDYGRQLNFTYSDIEGEQYLVQVEDENGRRVIFEYEEAPSDNPGFVTLRSITDPLGQVTSFEYGGRNQLTKVIEPEGNSPYTQTFKGGYLVAQEDAYGNRLTFSPVSSEVTDETIIETEYPDGTNRKFIHTHEGRVVQAVEDQAGNSVMFEAEAERDQITSVIDETGVQSNFFYNDVSGKLETFENGEEQSVHFTYTAQLQQFVNHDNDETFAFTFYNLTRIDYPDGTNEQFGYDGAGNIVSFRDREQQSFSYSYTDGLLVSVSNPTGGVLTQTYNSAGDLATVADPETGVTSFLYDAKLRLIKITYPDDSEKAFDYDDNDQLTTMTDQRGFLSVLEYDGNGNLTRFIDEALNETWYTYDLMNRLTAITDARGFTTVFSYGANERLEAITDPTGLEIAYTYDLRGWQSGITLGGESWVTEYDASGVPEGYSTPLELSTEIETNQLGNIVGLTDPVGGYRQISRDVMQRVTSITDPFDVSTTMDYDGWDSLRSISHPVLGTATYGRNELGLLNELEDNGGNIWTLHYSPMGRLVEMKDPLANTWMYSYDNLGRLHTTTFPDASMLTRSYDVTGNLTEKFYSDGGQQSFAYDVRGQLVQAGGIGLGYDAGSNIIETVNADLLVYGATYDEGGRLASVTYPATPEPLTVQYTYDPDHGMLSSVSDNLSSASVQFTYDADLRITQITRGNAVNSQLSWDDASRLLSIQHGGDEGLTYTLDGAGQIAQIEGVLLDELQHLLQGEIIHYSYDAANQISSPGFSYDSLGRRTADPVRAYTWNSGSQLIGIASAILTYNDFNDLILRTEGGSSSSFYYNWAIEGHPVVTTAASTPEKTAHYVYSPDGELLYTIDASAGNEVFYYHFDHLGSTIMLTNSSGEKTDSYLYLPSGKLVSHQGMSEQPFTFCGKWGVRQEGNSGALYQMRLRYYDAQSMSFLSRDAIWPVLDDIAGLNPYQYSRQNPLKYIDAMGLQPTIPGSKGRYTNTPRTTQKKGMWKRFTDWLYKDNHEYHFNTAKNLAEITSFGKGALYMSPALKSHMDKNSALKKLVRHNIDPREIDRRHWGGLSDETLGEMNKALKDPKVKKKVAIGAVKLIAKLHPASKFVADTYDAGEALYKTREIVKEMMKGGKKKCSKEKVVSSLFE